ncbi:MAG: cytochrome c oxidase assembly protein [Myxococcota bacterium]
METERLWSSGWALEPFLLLSIGVTGFLYWRGFRRLQTQLPHHFPGWRRDAFLLGLALLFIALASPLDGWADLLLQAHMVQHWLLMMVVPPLIWLGSPAVPLLRGLPAYVLNRGVGPLLASPSLRGFLRGVTHPPVAWGIWAAVLLIWHWPPAYEAALRARGWHDLEHACFLTAALLLWYPIICPWPAKNRQNPGLRLVYIGAVMLLNTLFSATFAFSSSVFYTAYTEIPSPWQVSALADQNAAGAFMWIAGSLPMLVAAVAVVVKWLSPSYAGTPVRVAASGRTPSRPFRPPAWLHSLVLRRSLQWGLFLVAAGIVVDGLFGPASPSAENLAGVLPWTYWRGFVVIGLLTLGNVFCAVCPFTLTRRLAALTLRRPLLWPSALQNKWLAAGLFILYLWAYEAFELWDSPAWTAWLIVGYFSLCFLIEGLFPRGTFCRYVCPIGQFNFTSASLSPFEVKSADTAVCRSCTTRDCLHGNDQFPGCPTELFLPAKAGNNDCTFCLDCVRACPHDNAQVIPVQPGRSIGQDRVAQRAPSADWVALSGVIVFGAFVNAAAMVAPVVRLESSLGDRLGLEPLTAQTLWFGLGLVVLPYLALLLCAAVGRWLSGTPLSVGVIIRRLAPALIPLGFGMWLAHLGFHLVTAYRSVVPAAERALLQVLPGLGSAGSPSLTGSLNGWVDLELIVLGLGLLVTLGVGWRISRELVGRATPAIQLALPWAALAILLYLAGAWIVLQPMEMRGMVM